MNPQQYATIDIGSRFTVIEYRLSVLEADNVSLKAHNAALKVEIETLKTDSTPKAHRTKTGATAAIPFKTIFKHIIGHEKAKNTTTFNNILDSLTAADGICKDDRDRNKILEHRKIYAEIAVTGTNQLAATSLLEKLVETIAAIGNANATLKEAWLAKPQVVDLCADFTKGKVGARSDTKSSGVDTTESLTHKLAGINLANSSTSWVTETAQVPVTDEQTKIHDALETLQQVVVTPAPAASSSFTASGGW
jgi:hypothetical protein